MTGNKSQPPASNDEAQIHALIETCDTQNPARLTYERIGKGTTHGVDDRHN